MTYKTEIKGRADFECRNHEEAKWLSLLINKFFQLRNIFPKGRNLFNLEYSFGNDDGIYTTVSGKNNKVYLSIHANNFKVNNENDSIIIFPIYFLSKQTRLIHCDFVIEGSKVGDLQFIKKNESGKIEYKKYKTDFLTIHHCDEYSLFDIIKNYPSFFEPIQYIIKSRITSNISQEEISVKGDDFEKKYPLSNIIKSFFTLFFEKVDYLKNIYTLNEKIKEYQLWKKRIEEFEVKQSDIEGLLTTEDSINDFDKDSIIDLMKLQAIFSRIINSLTNNYEHSNAFIKLTHKDEYLSKTKYYSTLYFEILPSSFYFNCNFGTKVFDSTLEEYYKTNYQLTEEQNNIQEVFNRLLSNRFPMLQPPLSFIQLCNFSGDFYEYCKSLPKIYIHDDFNIPLDTHFVSLFFNELSGGFFSDTGDNTYYLIEKNHKKRKEFTSLCELCMHRIRKTTIGCNGCFDFKLTS